MGWIGVGDTDGFWANPTLDFSRSYPSAQAQAASVILSIEAYDKAGGCKSMIAIVFPIIMGLIFVLGAFMEIGIGLAFHDPQQYAFAAIMGLGAVGHFSLVVWIWRR